MLEQIKLNKVRGVGGIVFCTLLLFTSLLGLILIIRKSTRLRLRNVPEVRLFGAVSLGTSAFWGFIAIAISTYLAINYAVDVIYEDVKTSADLWMILWMTFPTYLAGFFLCIYQKDYRIYKELADQVLELVSKNPCISVAGMRSFKGREWSSEDMKALLADLRDNNMIAFDQIEEDTFEVQIIHPKLKAVCEERRIVFPAMEWTCKACGALNNSPLTVPCEYCGTNFLK